MGQIINGKARSAAIKEELKQKVAGLKKKGIQIKLVVILIGDNPASQTYVSFKEKACKAIGINSEVQRLDKDVREETALNLIKKLNADKNVHGFMIQLPLPKHLNERKLLDSIAPEKDVDGLHTMSMGRLVIGKEPGFVPCTPQGIMDLILSTGIEIKGKRAVVVGRSNIVGKPIAALLMHQHATITIAHSRTQNLGAVCREADILVAAIGRAKMIKADMIKPGAVVIDVGMNRDENGKLCGDVDFSAAEKVAGYITPVPGGVGPMTIAMLLKNTVLAAERKS
ncbi:MAG: bifunctional methylenetetrahydrofolate dehydrogenase/methenyltetrahydrofolate cyclohydrolase FolD [Candidatus Saganbacteria bacterium]|nr:bifunctional methylenetetrahydrofolate dehydrogenase/methenyltetrahydrofolate cyclohydrolase FolD [Candidatus Saganbacteria bacterium]